MNIRQFCVLILFDGVEILTKKTCPLALLEKLEDAGYGEQELEALQNLVKADNGYLFDVLEYISCV